MNHKKARAGEKKNAGPRASTPHLGTDRVMAPASRTAQIGKKGTLSRKSTSRLTRTSLGGFSSSFSRRMQVTRLVLAQRLKQAHMWDAFLPVPNKILYPKERASFVLSPQRSSAIHNAKLQLQKTHWPQWNRTQPPLRDDCTGQSLAS